MHPWASRSRSALPGLMNDHDYFAVVCQYPSTTGLIHDLKAYVEQAHANSNAFIVCADLLAPTLLVPRASSDRHRGGSTQRFGMPMGAGGPHAAYLACRDEFKRSARYRAAWSVSARTRKAPPTAWRCRRVSSTSAARRPPATSARPRCCRPWWPAYVRRLSRAPGPDAHRRARGQLCRHPC